MFIAYEINLLVRQLNGTVQRQWYSPTSMVRSNVNGTVQRQWYGPTPMVRSNVKARVNVSTTLGVSLSKNCTITAKY